jgi:hypothetical protein
MHILKVVKTVFKVSSFVLRSAIGGAAVASVCAAVILKSTAKRNQRKKID